MCCAVCGVALNETADSLNNMGLVLHEMARGQEAFAAYQRALQLCRMSFLFSFFFVFVLFCFVFCVALSAVQDLVVEALA